MHRRLGLGTVVAAAVLAGCLGASTAPLEAGASGRPALEEMRVELTDCVEGGGHTVYNQDGFLNLYRLHFAPPEWTPADVREDVNHPLFTTTREPVLGPVHGYYHATLACASGTFRGQTYSPWVSGHVGIRIEPPPFDTGGADRHYLISTLPLPDEALRAAFRAWDIPATTGGGLVELEPSWHSVLEDELNGTYESFNEMEDLGPVPDHVVRLWFTVQVAEESWRPVALDMVTTGATHLAAQGGGKFSHHRDGHEEPGPVAQVLGEVLPGSVAGLGWLGFDRVMVPGPQPDVTLEHAFVHH